VMVEDTTDEELVVVLEDRVPLGADGVEVDNVDDSEDKAEDTVDDDDGTREEDGRVDEVDETKPSVDELDRTWLEELIAVVEETDTELLLTVVSPQILSHVDPNPVDTVEMEL
jgi:hypothetical protein